MITCPNCDREIGSENLNIQTDIAKCDSCQNIFKVSEILVNQVDANFNMSKPPKGAWIEKEFNQTIIGTTTRSSIAYFLVPFMLVWSGGSLGGIYITQLISGKFDVMMSLFGIPFLLGSIFFWGITLMAIFGKVELTLDKYGGRIFTGIGSIGLIKNFYWKEISGIHERHSNLRYPRSNGSVIALEGTRRITFGTGLTANRRYYLFNALRSIAKKHM